jgi:predicted anti-sigma-YlaC factor YlaD
MDISGTECARARESVSADLDRELHELDERRLQAHLRVCAECSAWADSVRAVTRSLRSAPLEELEALAVDAFERPGRRRTWRVRPAVAVAPALALVAGIAVSLATAQNRPLGGQPGTSTAFVPAGGHVVVNPDFGTAIPATHWVFRPV